MSVFGKCQTLFFFFSEKQFAQRVMKVKEIICSCFTFGFTKSVCLFVLRLYDQVNRIGGHVKRGQFA